MFTPEELEELRRADAELDKSFTQTNEEIRESRERDRQAQLDQMAPEKRKRAAYKRAYYEANKEEIAAKQRAYYEANKEEIAAYQRAYREANKEEIAAYKRAWHKNNREKWNAYSREYRKRKKLQQQTPEPSG